MRALNDAAALDDREEWGGNLLPGRLRKSKRRTTASKLRRRRVGNFVNANN